MSSLSLVQVQVEFTPPLEFMLENGQMVHSPQTVKML